MYWFLILKYIATLVYFYYYYYYYYLQILYIGGQRSKSTPRGAAAKFASSGKKTGKKNLGLIFMSYGYIYVAQVSLGLLFKGCLCCLINYLPKGANHVQCLRAIQEAEAFPGPSIIIAYSVLYI
jgi:pyruvate-ferredoxin/flavodoxin oxidoreductase